MALFELDDVFTYQDANDIKRFWASTDAPTDPGTGEVWLDLDVSPIVLRRWNGTAWDAIGELTAAQLLSLIKTVDGSGSGLDADLLDGQDSDFFRNASNLNAGTVNLARIPATLTGKSADQLDGLNSTQFIRSDATDNVSASTEWQNNCSIIVGTNANGRFYSNGTNVYLFADTGNLDLRNRTHGGLIYLRAENSSGTLVNLMTMNPDTERVTTKLDRSSLPDLWRDMDSDLTASPYFQSGNKYNVANSIWHNVFFDEAYTEQPRVVACNLSSSTTDGPTCWVSSITTTYFKVRSSILSKVQWISLGSKT